MTTTEHSDQIMRAARAVEEAFPSMSYIDVHRVVEVAIQTYDSACAEYTREAVAQDIEYEADRLLENGPSDLVSFAATWLRNGAIVAREGTIPGVEDDES